MSIYDTRVVVMQTYGEKLEAAINKQIVVELAERDMTQKALAEAIGIERATLNRYLSAGKSSMPMPVLFRVAEVFGISPRVLLERAEARIAHTEARTA